MLRALSASLLALVLAIPACAAPSEEEIEASESAVAADTAVGDVDASGRVTVRAGVLTLTFDGAARFETRGGARALVLAGRSSRNLAEIRSFVPDDAFGEATLTGPRTFELALRGGHEINTVLSGLPLNLSITTQHGSPRSYEAAVHLGASFVDPSGDTRLRVVPEVRPVHAGPVADPLRYRARLEMTRTPDAVTIASDDGGLATAIKRSPRRYDADWTFDAFFAAADPPGDPVHFVATYGAAQATTDARVDLRVRRLGLTTKTAELAWPDTCDASVRRCVSRAAQNGAVDLGDCGTYRQVATCQNEEPPPPPGVTSAEARIAADVLAKTGVRWEPAVVELRQEAGRSIALVAMGRGGLVEFAVGPGSAVSLERFVDRPRFYDLNLVTRFEKQLRRQHGMPSAKIVAHGTPAGMAPRWQFIVDRGGARSTVALEATSESASQVIPYAYDEGAFREIAGTLAVERGIAMASQSGPYAELEVYLRAMEKLSGPGGLELVDPADSPVGFTPSSETQLALYSIWGDNAIFVTINRATGAVRVDDFN